jgi:hypothetical protein
VETGRKKTKRSDRENAALARNEFDLDRATEEYTAADNNLRQSLPPLITVVFSLLPYLLAYQIEIQNALLAHYYTMLHNYCTEQNFPSPSPPMGEVVRMWEGDFKPIQQEAESIAILVSGKTVRMSMRIEESSGALNGYNARPVGQTLTRVPSTSPARALPPPNPGSDARPRIASVPSTGSMALLSPPESSAISPSASEYQTPQAFSASSSRTDYFARDRQLSTNSAASSISNLSATIAAKKKPPPPPPRLPSSQSLFVTALYDFAGQGAGDLAFKEGDRIRVVKKTDSTDDWWQGELRGARGSFPANYCEKV